MKYWSIWKLSDGVLITGKVSEIAASNLGLIMIMETSYSKSTVQEVLFNGR